MQTRPDAQNTPLRRDADLVKKLPESDAPPPIRSGFRRHFEGFELGLVTVGMVLTFALLVLPRAAAPQMLPLPHIDRSEIRRSEIAERERAKRAEREGLPFDVRAVGEAVRRFGRASAAGEATSHERDDIRARVKGVFDANEAPLLLLLRAVQTQYFLAALEQAEGGAKPSPELDELGGNFVAHARRSGWFDSSGRLLPDEATLRVLFHLYWADLIGKRGVYPFAPSLNEWRIYYRFLLQHPERGSDPASATADEDSARLRVATALGAKDPEYPLEMALGYLLYRTGDSEGAAVSYRRQLAKHQGGPYALLARNYLIYVLQNVSTE